MTGLTLRIVIGTAGSGKSTIAQRLAREYGAAYLDKDAMSARFVEAALLAARKEKEAAAAAAAPAVRGAVGRRPRPSAARRGRAECATKNVRVD